MANRANRAVETANAYSGKRVSIVCCNSGFDRRAEMVCSWFQSNGATTQLLLSSWDHQGKRERGAPVGGSTIHVRPYKRNISLARVLSCRDFSSGAFEAVKSFSPDVIYALIPANQLAKFMAKYKSENPYCRLIFDVCDLWPEAFPSKLFAVTPAHPVWRQLRNGGLIKADLVIAECDMFARVLESQLKNGAIPSLYYARADSGIEPEPHLDNTEYRLCYLGSINNIIDIEEITRVVSALPKQAVVEIIGDGENRDAFLASLKTAGVETVFHGRVYDDAMKHQIMNRCHFGLNIMKQQVAVGLTTKSIDYLEAGLPILNEIEGDTAELVDKWKTGINISRGSGPFSDELDASIGYRNNARTAYEELFSEKAFFQRLDSLLL